MAVIAQVQARYIGNSLGVPSATRGGQEQSAYVVEDASETWAVGAFITKNSDGEMEALGSGVPTTIAGQVFAAATGATGSPVFYRPMRVGDRYVCNVHHDTAESAVTAQNQFDRMTNFSYDNGLLGADIETAYDDTKPGGRIIGFWPEDAFDDRYGRVIIEVMDNKGLLG